MTKSSRVVTALVGIVVRGCRCVISNHTVYSESLLIFILCNVFISHGVENYFSGLWGTSISDAIFKSLAFYFITFVYIIRHKITVLETFAEIVFAPKISVCKKYLMTP